MGHLTPIGAFATSVSAGTWIELLIAIGVVALNYYAMTRIISQAGYSPVWILLPLAPLILTIVAFIIFWHDVNAIFFGDSVGFVGITTIGIVWHLDQLSFVANWAFFLVFAFSRWPVSEGRPSPSGGPARPPESPPNPAGRWSPNTPTAPVARGMPSSGASPGSGPAVAPVAAASPPPTRTTGPKICGWCGEALPGNRALFHDCGPKDRPETFCKSCGSAFPVGTSQCNSCGAV